MGISWEFGGNLNGILKVKDKIMAKKENEGLTDEQIRQLSKLEAESKEIAYRRTLPWQERWAGALKYIRENYDNVWKCYRYNTGSNTLICLKWNVTLL